MASTPEAIDFHGLPALRWRSSDGACAIATLQGAHLVSWIPAGGEECLYLSERSPFEAGRAIRGGVPIVFPQFAARGALPQHGYARIREWSYVGGSASFGLVTSEGFRLALTITLGGSRLDIQLSVENMSSTPRSFAAALHTYLRVSDVASVRLHGLGEVVTASEPIDHIFFAAPSSTRLEDGNRNIEIGQRGFFDTVVWNPGRERTAQMPDMPPEGYRQMLCVEAAAIEPRVILMPGNTWIGGQSINST